MQRLSDGDAGNPGGLPIVDPVISLKAIADCLSEILFGTANSCLISIWAVWRACKLATDPLPARKLFGRVTASKPELYAWACRQAQWVPPDPSGPGSGRKDDLLQIAESIACGVCGQYRFSFPMGAQLAIDLMPGQVGVYFENGQSRYGVEAYAAEGAAGCTVLVPANQLAFSFPGQGDQLAFSFAPVKPVAAWAYVAAARTATRKWRRVRLAVNGRCKPQKQRRVRTQRAASTRQLGRSTGRARSWGITRHMRDATVANGSDLRLLSRGPPPRRRKTRC